MNKEMQQAVQMLATECRSFPQVTVEMQHHTMNGMYARTATLKAGCLYTGCIHKTDHISIFCGDATLTLNDSVQRLTGYHVLPTKAGMARAIFAHGDGWITTLFRTNKNVLSEMEDELVENPECLQTRCPELSANKFVLIGE